MKQVLRVGAGLAACVMMAAFAWAAGEGEDVTLKVGDAAPDFKLPVAEDAPEDTPKKLSDYKGKKNVVLAFYPKADTPGCTKQLCGYRDRFEKFQSADTEIIAISGDKQDASEAFKQKFEMPFMVLGDNDGSIIKSYGVPARGNDAMKFAQRSVFVVDKEGKIRYIDMEYDIANDETPLLENIAKLGGGQAEG